MQPTRLVNSEPPRLKPDVRPTIIKAMLPTLVTVAWVITAIGSLQVPDPPETQEILRLERVWNEAHLRGDVAALDALCATDLIVTVPGMKPMSKADILGFWQSGRAKITRY
ncbi:MAG TPA: nuclear transport factor 2 family protein, partial [Steroidobacteraceae bacterium]|nr:nuclear transport factor 2 family protein [Steroidobacteraceae bacterium]